MIRDRLLALGGVIVATGTVLGAGAVAAYAQDPTDSTPPSATTTQGANIEGERSEVMAEFLAALANRLGITQDELEQALKDSGLQVIDDRLAAGDITQEQADRARERVEDGDWFGFGGHGPRLEVHGVGPGVAMNLDGLANLFGTDIESLMESLHSGQTLAQVAEANGVSRDDLKAYLRSELEERLADIVADGHLSQEEADEKLAEFDENIDERIDSSGPIGRGITRHHFGGPGPFGGAFPGERGFDSQDEDSGTPNTSSLDIS